MVTSTSEVYNYKQRSWSNHCPANQTQMLTRREKLLIRPWQQRRFQSHRRKVQSALPSIDASPPKSRGHVTCKLKKLQSEEERVERIELDNVRLLQRMAAIMRTSRLDNRWLTEPPGSFLGRIGIYAPLHSTSSCRQSVELSAEMQMNLVPVTTGSSAAGRKAKCPACCLKLQEQSNREMQQQTTLPSHVEGSPKTRMRTYPSEEHCSPPQDTKNLMTKPKSRKKKVREVEEAVRRRCEEEKEEHRRRRNTPEWVESSNNRVVLTRGQLQVSLSFPHHTSVTIQRVGCPPTVVESEYCSCSAITPLPRCPQTSM